MAENKYDYKTWPTTGIIDVKENMIYRYKIFETVNLTLHGH